MIITIIKQPGEQLQEAAPFPAAVTVVQSVAAMARGLVPGSAALTVVGVISSGQAIVTIGGGSDGERYLVTIRAGDAAGQVIEAEIEVVVIEGSWALPDGGAPYLTITAFVDRFGLDEVVRMTDGDGAGRIDRKLLIAALIDAQAVVDAHLAGRYALPLATTPPVIALAVADLARARLYPRGAPDGVGDAAKSALRMMERIQGGQMTLGVAAADVPATATETPILISKGTRQYPNGLAGY